MLWFDSAKLKSATETWADNLKHIMAFDTVEDFWALFNNVMPPSMLEVRPRSVTCWYSLDRFPLLRPRLPRLQLVGCARVAAVLPGETGEATAPPPSPPPCVCI